LLPAELLHLGRDYPQGYNFFRPRLHRAFMAKANLTDEGEIREGIARADFVRKGNVDIVIELIFHMPGSGGQIEGILVKTKTELTVSTRMIEIEAL
jgi:hypothetical protein